MDETETISFSPVKTVICREKLQSTDKLLGDLSSPKGVEISIKFMRLEEFQIDVLPVDLSGFCSFWLRRQSSELTIPETELASGM